MTSSEEKIILLSKTKLIGLVFGSLLFMCLGLFFILLDNSIIESQRPFNNPMVIHTIGWLSLIFFGLTGVYGLRKLFDKEPGLIFSNTGITDNSSAVAAGFIPWSEIESFDIYEVLNQRMLVVLVKDPEKYIESASKYKRALIRTNFNMCGSPIAISPNSLKINFSDLLETCSEYYKKYGAASN